MLNIANATEALTRIPVLHYPGERFTYGFNTDVLGRLIEIRSGETLDRYLWKAILKPLEMVDTGFFVPSKKRDRFATCHKEKDGRLYVTDKASDSPFNKGFKFISGGGGLVSTMQDYANFCEIAKADSEENAFLKKRPLDSCSPTNWKA